MKLLFGIVIALSLAFMVCIYYAGNDWKEAIGLNEKIKSIFKRSKNEYIILAVSVVVSIATFVVSQYVYDQADVFWTYRWQIAIGILIPIAVIDQKIQIIPNKLLLIGSIFMVIIIVAQIINSPDYILSIVGNSFVGFLLGGGVFFFAALLVKNGIGAGDIKLFVFLGFLLAFRGVFNVLLYSMVISAVLSIALILSKKKTMKDELPLGPFALLGVIISILFGV